ncbi:MAG: patatin-like phospholipase family protein [Deltaproteobacteria bacterium]|nr:patatin-like phospholipase family protein [Deltaproteobacteria bacterium]MBT6489131.1 patatin-like phospholipase family protein [Deltaproteobacteria bacterium]
MRKQRSPEFKNVVFAGGGSRCFWQAGFWQGATAYMNIKPMMMGAVSAGAAMACLISANNVQGGLETFKEGVGRNPRNFYLGDALRRKNPFPHETIYRDALATGLGGENLERLRKGPELRVLVTKLSGDVGRKYGLVAGYTIYCLKGRISPSLHAHALRRVGFKPAIRNARSCNEVGELVSLIMASSSTPPITPLATIDGSPALDGGFVDNIPVETVDESLGETLILLSQRYPDGKIPRKSGRTYVQPSRQIPVAKWDCTSPDKIQATFDLGLEDGKSFTRRYHLN